MIKENKYDNYDLLIIQPQSWPKENRKMTSKNHAAYALDYIIFKFTQKKKNNKKFSLIQTSWSLIKSFKFLSSFLRVGRRVGSSFQH